MRRLLVAALGLTLCVALVSACATSTPTPTVSAPPSGWPKAPPVTPEPGEAFIGYWRDQSPTSPELEYVEVLGSTRGYLVSIGGQGPIEVPEENGRLILQRLSETPAEGGSSITPALEVAWEDERCVLFSKWGVDEPAERSALARVSRGDYEKGVTRVADSEVRTSLEQLALGVDAWVAQGGKHPPAVSQMRSGSEFSEWLDDLAGGSGWSWPVNPFSGQPMKNGNSAGDFTYTTDGTNWELKGHLSDGTTFGALSGSSVP